MSLVIILFGIDCLLVLGEAKFKLLNVLEVFRFLLDMNARLLHLS